jgi:hypothetical protein
MEEAKFGAPKEGETFELNLETADGQDPNGRIPRGHYAGKIIHIKDDVSKSSGNPMWVVTVVITGTKHPGREFKVYLVKTPGGAWKIKEMLQAVGLPTEPIRFTSTDIINKPIVLLIDDDEYMGQQRSKCVGMRESGFMGVH